MVSIPSTNDCTGHAHYQSSIMVRILAFLPLHGLGTLVIIPTKQSVYNSTVGGWEAIVMVAWCAKIIWYIGCFNMDYATASDEVVYMPDGTAEWDILNEGKSSFIL